MFRLLFLHRRPPVSTGSELPPRTTPPDTDGRLTTLAKGVNVYAGKVTHPAVAEAVGRKAESLTALV